MHLLSPSSLGSVPAAYRGRRNHPKGTIKITNGLGGVQVAGPDFLHDLVVRVGRWGPGPRRPEFRAPPVLAGPGWPGRLVWGVFPDGSRAEFQGGREKTGARARRAILGARERRAYREPDRRERRRRPPRAPRGARARSTGDAARRCSRRARRVTRRVLPHGVETTAWTRSRVVGGDGTLNEVVQAYVDAEGRPATRARPRPRARGDRQRLPKDARHRLARRGRRRATGSAPSRARFDLGILELTAHDGTPIVRAFLNITSFGLGGLTDRIVNAGPKWIGGKAAFYVGRAARARRLQERAGARAR